MGDLKQKTMKWMHGGEGEELLHKEDTEAVCRAAGIKKKARRHRDAKPPRGVCGLKVQSTRHRPWMFWPSQSCAQCKLTKGVITNVKKMSLLLNWGRRSVPFWHNFSILDIEALTSGSPSALQVHTFTISRVTSESQNSIYLNNLTNKSTSIDE